MILIGKLNDCFMDIPTLDLLLSVTSQLFKNNIHTKHVTIMTIHVLILYKLV